MSRSSWREKRPLLPRVLSLFVCHRDHGKSVDAEPSSPTSSQRAPSPLRNPPKRGFKKYDSSWIVEEEMYPWYSGKEWYPVRVGQVFKERYQVLGKLFFGSVSTVWLCRDLTGHKYVALKVYVRKYRQADQEPRIFAHLQNVKSDHGGQKYVRVACDTFFAQRKDIRGQQHQCLVFEPLGMSLKELCEFSEGGRVKPAVLKPIIRTLLEALDYLHTEAGVVHTDIQGGNILFRMKDPESAFQEFERDQWQNPPGRKNKGKRVIYDSRDVPQSIDDLGPPVLCDFGDAVMGEETYAGHVMPDLYRAPEMIMGVKWDEKIDIWGLAMTIWDAVEGEHLFKDKTQGRFEADGEHLAMTIALLGIPTKEMAQSGGKSDQYFDEEGNWKADVEIPKTSLEEEEKVLQGEERDKFLAFMRRILQWDSDDRPSAKKLLDDPWLLVEDLPGDEPMGEEKLQLGEA
ncbi:kinase-like domain-containing protein [Phyllosticta capitalensis]|uniref:non-specific serine/threonine protein kinase n=1 Tax=Phyllosticta capitalensis TaxID=121624 RepID=A0ABR1YXG8_9PEZI